MNLNINLSDFGWDEYFENEFNKIDEKVIPARVISDNGQFVRAITEDGELMIQRRLRTSDETLQVGVGDFIAIDKIEGTNHIHSVIPRKTKFSRTAAGDILYEQIVAANVDIVFIMQSLNNDFSVRRLERYLIAAWESGANPVDVLTKADLCDDIELKKALVYEVAMGVDVLAISSITGKGLDAVKGYVKKGKTIALLGSSGVGKSTLANAMAASELLKTGTIREYDSRGRHTTTHRELVLLPDGGLILDTPGMRTLVLWEGEKSVDRMFDDIAELVKKCKFRDCKHENEPGCAVREALENGAIDEKRWESYIKLQKELKYIDGKKIRKERIKEKRNYNRRQQKTERFVEEYV
jgi:ribosome biogenesis GTPase